MNMNAPAADRCPLASVGRRQWGVAVLRSGRSAGPVGRDQASRPEPQKVSFQLLRRPVSEAATSWTRSFQVPLATSLEAFTE